VREVFSLHMSRGRLLSAVGLIKLLKLARRMRSFGLVWLGVVWLVALRLRNGLRLGCLGLLLLLVQLLDRLDLLLQLHSPILEPNFDLSLCEAELVSHLDAPPPSEVMVRVELLLQLQGLVPCISLSAPSPKSVCSREEVGSP